MHYNFDYIKGKYEEGSFCGLHGRVHVEPDTPQIPLLHTEEPDCGYAPKQRATQLELDF